MGSKITCTSNLSDHVIAAFNTGIAERCEITDRLPRTRDGECPYIGNSKTLVDAKLSMSKCFGGLGHFPPDISPRTFLPGEKC